MFHTLEIGCNISLAWLETYLLGNGDITIWSFFFAYFFFLVSEETFWFLASGVQPEKQEMKLFLKS